MKKTYVLPQQKRLEIIIEKFKDKLMPEELEWLLASGHYIYQFGNGLTYSFVRAELVKAYGRELIDGLF